MVADLVALVVGVVALAASLGMARVLGQLEAQSAFHQQTEYRTQMVGLQWAATAMGVAALVIVMLGDEVLAWMV